MNKITLTKKTDSQEEALLRQVFVVGAIFLTGWLLWSFLYTSPESLADYQTTGRTYPESDLVTSFQDEDGNDGCLGGSCGSGHWAVLDEVSYDFTDYIFDENGGNGEVEEFEMTSAAGPNAVNEVRVNFRARVANPSGSCAAGCDRISADIFIGGAYRGAQEVILPTTDQQHTLVFAPSALETCAGIPNRWCGDGDLRVRLQRVAQGAADDIRISRLYADVDFIQDNDPPAVTSVATDPDPADVVQGDSITFEIDWSDPDGDSARAIVCKTNAIVGGATPGCPGDAWTDPSGISNDENDSIILTYKTTSNDADPPPGINNYYVFVCDTPGGECSSTIPGVTSGIFTVEAITAELYGWAWSSNIGWVSFDANDCDTDENGFIDSGLCEGDNTTDQVFDYGVFLDTSTGNLSGFAWSSNIGWVTFNRADAGNPPEAPFSGGSGPIARLEGPNLRGWARALSNGGGWDGWIKLGD